MGANSSKQEVTNEALNDIMISVMTENSTSVSGSSDQTNEINLVGSNNVTIDGVSQINTSKINVEALAQSTAENKLQADLVSKIGNKVEQTYPAIAIGSDTDQSIKTSIKNIINSNITTKNFQNVAATAKQKNALNIIGSNSVTARNISQRSESELIVKIVQTTTSEILSAIKAKAEVTNEASQKQAPLLDFGAGGIIFIIVIIIIGGFFYYVKSSGLAIAEIVAKPQVIALIIFVIGLSAFGIYSATKK